MISIHIVFLKIPAEERNFVQLDYVGLFYYYTSKILNFFVLKIYQSLPQVPWSIPESEFKYRRDLRNLCIFTIDPASARDLDDALHCIKLDEDTYEIGVHIADVSFFVTENSPIDRCAIDRTTSVYLVQKVIPMLPRLLCEELCSLNPLLDRLTFSVIWKVKANGDVSVLVAIEKF